MSKLQDLRAAVLAADPKIEADQLFTFLRQGQIRNTGAGIRYEATAIVVITEWGGSAHPIARALTQWLASFENAATDALAFEVDIISHPLIDLHFELPFTENVVFDGPEFEACAGPLPDPEQMLRYAPGAGP